jgi:uncharacterized membrane protein
VPETTRSGFSDNTIAALAYISFVPAMFFLVLRRYKSRPYIRFHAWQSIFLNFAAFSISLALSMLAQPALHQGAYYLLSAARVVWAIWFGLWIATSLTALNGKHFSIPVLGKMAERMAK